MSKWGWAARIGGYALAPWTGGMSIPAGELGARAIESRQAANDSPDGGDDEDHPENAITRMLQQSSAQTRNQAGALAGLGSEALTPSLQFLRDILSSNPSAVMDATRQDRGRVMDQYDTARRTISNFGPRGGGTTSALAESRFAEGETLADVVSSARSQAVRDSSQLGLNLTGLGLSADQLASADLNSVLQAIFAREGIDVTKRGQNMEAWGNAMEAAGTLVGILMTRQAA